MLQPDGLQLSPDTLASYVAKKVASSSCHRGSLYDQTYTSKRLGYTRNDLLIGTTFFCDWPLGIHIYQKYVVPMASMKIKLYSNRVCHCKKGFKKYKAA